MLDVEKLNAWPREMVPAKRSVRAALRRGVLRNLCTPAREDGVLAWGICDLLITDFSPAVWDTEVLHELRIATLV